MVTPAPALRERRLLMEEFIRLSGEGDPFEWIDGERVPKMPNVYGHSQTAHMLYDSLAPFVRSHKLGHIYIETTFVMTDDPQWVRGSRIPDVMFIQQHRMDAYRTANPGYTGRPLMLVPDLVVEVVSKNEKYVDVENKVNIYRQDGVQIVWVVDLGTRSISIRSRSYERTLSMGDTLTAPDLLPGFELPLHTVFAG